MFIRLNRLLVRMIRAITPRVHKSFLKSLLSDHETQVWEMPYSRPDIACHLLEVLRNEFPVSVMPYLHLLVSKKEIIIISCFKKKYYPRFSGDLQNLIGVTRNYSTPPAFFLSLVNHGVYKLVEREATSADVLRLCPQSDTVTQISCGEEQGNG